MNTPLSRGGEKKRAGNPRSKNLVRVQNFLSFNYPNATTRRRQRKLQDLGQGSKASARTYANDRRVSAATTTTMVYSARFGRVAARERRGKRDAIYTPV